MAAVKNVLSWLDRTDKIYLAPGRVPYTGLHGDIVFDSVDFRYGPDNRRALSGASFRIQRGRITGIVGASGAGKSTLIDLLCRQYDPEAGEIRIDGVPLTELILTQWTSRLALVSQTVQLFNGTIRENIAFGRPTAQEQDIVEAAVRAHAHDFILELPQGYETQMKDAGSRLSGGQRQRIALARTLARTLARAADLIILDETTSALDPLSETLVQQALVSLPTGCTVVVIAQRRSTIDDRRSTIECADHIVVLDKGQVVQHGTLAMLTERDGVFREMYGP